jgi:phenylacetate-CoA ligase
MMPSMRSYLDVLRQTRVMPQEQLLEYQRGLLEKMVRHARAYVPFYRDRLDALFTENGRFSLARWGELPVLTRAAAAQAGAELFATELPAENSEWSERQTSGSTGLPLRHRRSTVANFVSMCVKHRDYESYRLNFDSPVASIQAIHRGPSDIPEGAPRRWNFYGKGPILVFDVRSSIEQQFEWLLKVQVPYLRVFASLLKGLAEHAIRMGTYLPFEAMFPYGENLSPETRDLASSAFSGRVIGSYGATEIGRIASECAACGRYHVPVEIVVVEILREDGSIARPGEAGRVVVTSLYNFAMPLLRYEIGDLAEAGPDGQCVFTLPTLSRILGRTRNLFKLRDGSRVWPDTRTSEMQRYVGLSQVQIVQTGVEEVEVRYVPDGSSRPVNAAGLQEYFRSVIHPSLMVKAVAVKEIARTPSGKFEDYVSLVA